MRLAPHKTDEQRAGEIILMAPSMQMLEIIVWSKALDMALVEKLDMEGGKTGRHGHIRPSRVVSSL